MVEKALETFINTIIHYFQTTYGINVEIGSPYLINDPTELNGDYTGIIEISGEYRGWCYFSTPKSLLQTVIQSLSIDVDLNSEVVLTDIAGEIANILSGNARAELGQNFVISIPKVYSGSNAIEAITADERTYAIPITWKNEKAFLGVALS
jgi:chemotaxis protein CheX